MFILRKQFRFEAAHRLPFHDGKCQRLHGHSFVGVVEVMSAALVATGPKSGMVMDFADLSKPVNELVENYLDHYYLNETLELQDPTSEEIAKWIFDKLRTKLPMLSAVEIQETCTSSCRFESLPIVPGA